MTIFWSVIGFIIAMGLLVAIHEWGHYITARLLGINVVRFSVGFGKTIYSKTWRGTEFQLALIPLGGYVKFLDERDMDSSNQDFEQSYNRQSVFKRFLVVAAGPAINLVFAWIVFSLIYFSGISGYKAVLDTTKLNSPAYQVLGVDFVPQEIIKINQKDIHTWQEVNQQIALALINNQDSIEITLQEFEVDKLAPKEEQREVTLPITSLDVNSPDKNWLNQLGFIGKLPNMPAVLSEIRENTAAKSAGFKSGDIILEVDGVYIENWYQFVKKVRENPNKNLDIRYERQGIKFNKLVFIGSTEEASPRGFFGASVEFDENIIEPYRASSNYSLLSSLKMGLEHSVDLVNMTLKMLSRMLTGEVDASNLSGPITIADYSGKALQSDWVSFFTLLALLSLSLGVLNLLPIPVLDGGHLMLYIIEMIKGSPISVGSQIVLQKIGLIFILSITAFAIFNDVVRVTNV